MCVGLSHPNKLVVRQLKGFGRLCTWSILGYIHRGDSQSAVATQTSATDASLAKSSHARE